MLYLLIFMGFHDEQKRAKTNRITEKRTQEKRKRK